MGRIVGVHGCNGGLDQSMYVQALAWSAVEAGLSVLVVDYGRRGPAGSAAFSGGGRGPDERPGLAQVIAGEVELLDVVAGDPWGGFDVLPAGAGLRGQAEAAGLHRVLSVQAGDYDLVLVAFPEPGILQAAYAVDALLLLSYPFFAAVKQIPARLAQLHEVRRLPVAHADTGPRGLAQVAGVVLVGPPKRYDAAMQAARSISQAMAEAGMEVLFPGVPDVQATRREWEGRTWSDPRKGAQVADLLERTAQHLRVLAAPLGLEVQTRTDVQRLPGVAGPAGGRFGAGAVSVAVPAEVLDQLVLSTSLSGRAWDGDVSELVVQVLQAETARAKASAAYLLGPDRSASRARAQHEDTSPA